jgi:PAS domain S-box-containing protein
VFDRTGTTVARVPNADRFIGVRASPSFYPHLVSRNEGVVRTTTQEGVPALTAFSRSEPSGWSVGIGIPEAEFTAPLWRSLVVTLLIGGALLLLGLILAFWIARGIADPIRSLARTATDPDGRGIAGNTGLVEVDEVARQLREAIADRRAAELAHGESEERIRLILESASEYAILTLDPDGRITSWNTGAERILGYSEREVIGQPGHIFFTDEDIAAEMPQKEIASARSEGRAANERWHKRKDGSLFWGSGVMLPLAERQRGFLKIFRDQTEEREHEEAQKLLINELNHRVKNTLATVQSIAAQTLRASATTAEARPAFEERLFALAKAHDVLTRENWEGASLGDVVEEALAAHTDRHGTRFDIDGPDVRLAPRAALAIAMALNELATNAVKYGALSNESGRVLLRWRVAPDAGGPVLHLTWEEAGGPPVAPPERKGFGSRLIERGLAADLGGEVRLDYRPTGLVCTIAAPLSAPAADHAPEARIAAQ